jgi:cardiolipin synthase
MEAMYLEDLANATEIVPGLLTRRKQAQNMRSRRMRRPGRGGVRRLAAGALALSNSIGKAASARSLTTTEANSIALIGAALLAVATIVTLFPALIVAPLVIGLAWLGLALLIRAFRLNWRVRLQRRKRVLRRRLARTRSEDAASDPDTPGGTR